VTIVSCLDRSLNRYVLFSSVLNSRIISRRPLRDDDSDPAKLMAHDAKFEATGMPDREWWAALWPDPREVLQKIGLSEGASAVDLCCGDGYFTAPMALLSGREICAVEIDPAMLAAARDEVARAGVDNVRFVEGDAMDLASLLPAKVDFVLIANTFHGVPDKLALASAVRDVLPVGGIFVVVNWWPKPREETTVLGKPRGPRETLRFSPEQVLSWIGPAGFELRAVEEVGPYHYGAVFGAV
jgi:SAM-dependent methyltransferase